jgi:hypothetical protein
LIIVNYNNKYYNFLVHLGETRMGALVSRPRRRNPHREPPSDQKPVSFKDYEEDNGFVVIMMNGSAPEPAPQPAPQPAPEPIEVSDGPCGDVDSVVMTRLYTVYLWGDGLLSLEEFEADKDVQKVLAAVLSDPEYADGELNDIIEKILDTM